jgi:hypothetical protein
MFILQIFVTAILILIYIYSGLRLTESIKNETIMIYFWMVYIILGVTLLNTVAISQYWGKLSTKTAPPGPRGPRGDDGDIGPEGQCTSSTNIVYAQKEIKDTIASIIKDNYKDLAIDDVYDKEKLKLKNNYLDYKIKQMVTSKQFDTVLFTPSDDNNPNKNKTETKLYGKTIEDLSGYLASTWGEWITGIIKEDKENARTLFITFDAQIDISPKIENYFNNEIMKYDVWYWGATRVFRPLEAEICREEYTTEDGVTRPNSRYPMNNKPKVDTLELKFTDISIKSDDRFELLAVLNIGDIENWQKYNPDFKINYDIISKYPSTAFYIPKVYKVPTSKQIYYPIGCVAVNNSDSASDNERSTIIVSGDVIIPSSYKEIISNKLQLKDIQSDVIRYSRKRGRKKTRRYQKNFNTTTKYDVYLSDELVNRHNEYEIKSRESRVKLISELKDNVTFMEFTTSIPEYEVICDIPFVVDDNGEIPEKYRCFDKPKTYEGIVAVPKSCLMETENKKIWSFRYKGLLNKLYVKDFGSKPIPKPRWIGNGRHSKGTKNFSIGLARLKRTVENPSKFDIQEDNVYDLIKIRTTDNSNVKNYKMKKYCYKHDSYPIKKFDKIYEDLGFGWFGYPIKKYRKYSIFAYLGLMPEGIIVQRSTGRKFYIKHYGGVEPNKFIIYLWNDKKKDFSKAVTVKNSTTCVIGNAKKSDPRCQFKVIIDSENSNYFRIESVEYPKKYLKFNFSVNENANLRRDPTNKNDKSLLQLRPNGINLDHTEMSIHLSHIAGTLENRNPVIFFNQPATGTNMQIVEERIPRNIDRSKGVNEQYKEQQILDRTNKSSFNYLYKDNNVNELLDEKYPESILEFTERENPSTTFAVKKLL